jgi:hypothetical protein
MKREQMVPKIIQTQRESSFRGSMQTQSDPDLKESQWLRDFHSESIPPHIQMGERERDVVQA